jgi:hypothetical protein
MLYINEFMCSIFCTEETKTRNWASLPTWEFDSRGLWARISNYYVHRSESVECTGNLWINEYFLSTFSDKLMN